MPEFSDEIMKQYRNDCNKAKSNLEAPLLGKVLTPICKSCKNADYHYGTWDEPECLIYGEMPKKYFAADSYDCPHYNQIPNIDDAYLPEHMRKNNK